MFTLVNFFIIYVMGALMAGGLAYTVSSCGILEEKTNLSFYIGSIFLSWITVVVFFLGVIKGIFYVLRHK